MKLWFKKQTVPATNETREVDAVQLWRVEWRSRHARYHDSSLADPRQEVECFTSQEQAEAFAVSLRQAFKLLRFTGAGLDVVVRPNT